jgi:hypothetical protein
LKNIIFIAMLFLIANAHAHAVTYECAAKFQNHMGIEVKDDDFVKKHKPFTRIVDEQTIQRCSISYMQKSLSCDTYNVDKVESDKNIKKFYVFNSQYDIQIFADLSFIDNNGRGGMLFGKCKKQ